MPKSLDKTKGSRKRRITPNTSNNNTESDGSESKAGPKKKKMQKKRASLVGIEMSKELAALVKQKRTSRAGRSKNNEPRLCGNGKPMPPLAELEAMYRDSEDDEDTSSGKPVPLERCTTPEEKLELKEDLDSPSKLKLMASKAIDILSKSIEILDDTPPPQVIPPKKRKKPEVPFIVGCKDREQVPWAPKTKWCVGSEDYGVDKHSGDDDESCKKRKKRGQKLNVSKSLFNAKSDEIANHLKEAEELEKLRDGSPDSNDTVEYDYPNISPYRSIPRAFSPLPSTSKDSETIMKNERLFNDSLQCESLSNDVELIEVPCDTIVIDDSTNITNAELEKNNDDFDDDCCVIIEPEIKKSENVSNITHTDDVYSSIDLTETFDSEVYEIGDDEDIEKLLEENRTVLCKNNNKNNIDSVTAVDSSLIFVSETKPSVSNADQNLSNLNRGVEAAVDNPVILNTDPRPTGTDQSNKISDVVTNFFNQPQNNTNTPRSLGIADLSTCPERFRSKISSFLLSSIDFIFSGNRASRTNTNTSQDVVIIEDSTPASTSQHTQVTNMPDVPDSNRPLMSSITNVYPPLQKIHTLAHKNTRKQSAAAPTPPSPSNNSTCTPSGRHLGDCPICMDSLENNPVASTLCGHVFCMACIKASIKANGKKCPTCRKALKGAGYHQLFI